MSIASAPERSQAPYAEPDEYIDYQLRKTQVGIKRTDMLTAGVIAFTVLIGYVLLFVLSDHWLFEGGVGNTARVLMFLPVIGFVGWLVAAKVIWPALKNVNGLYAAKTLEASSSEFHSSLLNLIDLKQAGREVSPAILATMEKRAAVTLTKLNIDDAIDKRPLLHTLYVLFGIVVAFCLYSVLSPKQLGPSVLRAIAPFTNVTPATQTEFLEVKPGDAKLRAGGSLPIEVHLRGELPSKVTLHFTTADRRFVDEPFELSPSTEPQHFEGVLGEDGQGLLQSFAYYVVAGDARSPEYRVTIVTPPSATITEQRYQYPEYMELDPRTQHGGAIDVWERTAVSISGTTNIPIKRAELEFADTEDFTGVYPGPSVKIEEGKKLAINWRAEPRQQDNKFPKFYRVKVWDDEGNPDPKPTVYPINVRLDQSPQVVLLDPTASLEMPANGIVPLAVAARDPDFKLRTVTLKIARAGDKPSDKPRADGSFGMLDHVTDEPLFDGAQQEVGVKHDFALEPLKLKPGDKIKFWIEAQDNRLPTHNLAKTEPLEITIIDKVSKEEAKKQLDDKKQEQEKKLDEAKKNDNDQGNDPNEQQPGNNDRNQDNPKIALKVQLFDVESNKQLDVKDYTAKLGLNEPLFRGFVLGDCTGTRWSVSTIGSQDGDRRKIQPAPRDQQAIRHVIRQMPEPMFEQLDRGILHAIPQYRDCRLNQESTPAFQGRVTSALYREKAASEVEETKFTVYSELPRFDERIPFRLGTLESDLNARDREYYCKLPNGLNKLRKFARDAVGNQGGDTIEIAQRLIASLHANNGFSYDKNPSEGLPRIDTVEQFLLDSERRVAKGDCKQFNSALALMLREFKIPARMVLGFKGGKEENGEFVVRWKTSDGGGHAWVEAYLNGHWLILDATPASGNGGNQPDQSKDPMPGDDKDKNDPQQDPQKQDQADQPPQNKPQPEDKGGKGRNGSRGKQENGGKNDEASSDGESSGKPSVKNDGSEDDKALKKIAQRQNKKRPPQDDAGEPSAQRDPKEGAGNSSDNPPKERSPKPPDTSKPNQQTDPKNNEGNTTSKPDQKQQPQKNSKDPSDPKSSNGANKNDPSPMNPDDKNASNDPGSKTSPKESQLDEKLPMPNSDKGDSPKDKTEKSKSDGDDTTSNKKPMDDSKPGTESKPKGDESNNANDPKKPDGKDKKEGKDSSNDPKLNDPSGKEKTPSDQGSEKDPKKEGAEPKRRANDPKAPNKTPMKKDADGGNKPPDKDAVGDQADPKEKSKGDPGESETPSNEEPPKSKPNGNDPKADKGKKPNSDPKAPKQPGNTDGDQPSDKGIPSTDKDVPAGEEADKPSNNSDSKNTAPKKDSAPDTKSDPADSSEDGKPDKSASKKPKRGNPDKQSDDPADKKEPVNKGQEDKGADKKSDGKKGSQDGKESDDSKEKGDSKGKPSEGKKGKPSKPGAPSPSGKGTPSGTPGEGSASGSAPTDQNADPDKKRDGQGTSSSNRETPEEANPEFTKEAANLVLKRLKDELARGEVDQELLDELGWTPEQMKKFADRMQEQLEDKGEDDSPKAKAQRRQFEEMLRNLDVTSKTQRRNDNNKEKQAGEGVGSVRRPPPPEYRDWNESVTKSLSKKKGTEPQKK